MGMISTYSILLMVTFVGVNMSKLIIVLFDMLETGSVITSLKHAVRLRPVPKMFLAAYPYFQHWQE